MDSLYLNTIRYPNLIHANSPPTRYMDQMRWRVSNPDIGMHAGFADLQYGAFVPRWKVQTFMTQLGKSALGKDRIRLADMYFSLWTNQYPWILSNPLLLASGEKPAARRLQRTLEADLSDVPKDYFERIEDEPRLYERDVRASCGNDRCLFFTNMDHSPDPTLVKFDKDNITNIQQLERTYDELATLPSAEFWNEHAYHKAVDQDPSSCWSTYQNPKAGDYFGLITMGSIMPEELQIYTCNDIRRPEALFEVSVTDNGTDWTTCHTSATAAWQHVPPRVYIKLDCGNSIEQLRAIRISFLENGPEPFNVCGIALDTVVV
ncbi:hypothetical protein BDA99DRAFT_546264 [Phascolomyces articulosus]|uniref:Uncharacterized protein n=1 Tax=Phascolomyces articulosus TaxID=60185 RepID=A0AAD5K4N7_9FUNG|nr:hypothetical protein BDA99DRAFT_546264 [Phascolomyces articulosus]